MQRRFLLIQNIYFLLLFIFIFYFILFYLFIFFYGAHAAPPQMLSWAAAHIAHMRNCP